MPCFMLIVSPAHASYGDILCELWVQAQGVLCMYYVGLSPALGVRRAGIYGGSVLHEPCSMYVLVQS